MGGASGRSPVSSAIYTGTLDCVHCGLCLTSCPTYLATGRETSSPRGRIYLMRGAAEGRIGLEGLLAEEAHLCLGCRACETACPSGVEFGALLEETRAVVATASARRGSAALVARMERWLLRAVVAHRGRLRAAMSVLAWLQTLGLDRLAAGLLPRGLRHLPRLLPTVPKGSARGPLPEHTAAQGERRGRVAWFRGCVMPEIFGDVQRAGLRVLAREGFEVVVPPTQGCCGALHAHAGDLGFARGLAQHNAGVFASGDFDAIVVDSAGCGAAMKEGGRWIGEAGGQMAGRVRDVCEWLDAVGMREPPGRLEARVCYDDPCHLLHGQGVGDAPRRLLSRIEGLELVPHANAARCCGAAGTYNLTQPEMSARVLEEKMDALASADPDVIATGNPGCLMQLRAGVAARGLRARVLHPIELIDLAAGGGVAALSH